MSKKKSLWERIKYNDIMFNVDEELGKAVANASNYSAIERLLEIGANPYQETIVGSNQTTSFRQASRQGNIDLMSKFLEAECTNNETSANEIINSRRSAIKADKVESLSYLFEQGYIQNIQDDRLIASQSSSNKELMKQLFENENLEPPKSEEIDQCFVAAAKYGNLDNMRYLNELGADINASDGNDNAITALAKHESLSHIHWKPIVTYLKDNNFSFDAKDINGESATEIAARNGHKDLVFHLDQDFPEENIAKQRSSDVTFVPTVGL